MIKSDVYIGKCNGKINLSLYITDVLNGLHKLDSIMASIDMEDKVTYAKNESQLEIDIIDNVGNIDIERYKKVLLKSIKKIEKLYGEIKGKITLEKGVPLGQGLGGSTASLVAIMKALDASNRKNTHLDYGKLCCIGSDVPFMYQGGIKRVKGIGDQVDDICCDIKEDIYALLLFGTKAIDTSICYKTYDLLSEGKFDEVETNSLFDAINNPTNSLQNAAIRLNPEIDVNINLLKSLGASKVSMTGSGSAVYALSNTYESLLKIQKDLSQLSDKSSKIVKVIK